MTSRERAVADSGPPRSPRSRRALIPVLAVAAVLVIALAVVLSTGGSSPSSSKSTQRAAVGAGTHHATAKKPTAAASGSSTSASSGSTTSPASAAPATSSGASASGAGSGTSAPGGSAPATAGGPATSSGASSPISAVESFYHLAAAHQYASAWALADPTFRAQLGGYDSFQSGQRGDQSITFNSARVLNQSGSTATAQVSTTSVRTDGTKHCTGTVDLAAGATASQWLVHQIHIDCI